MKTHIFMIPENGIISVEQLEVLLGSKKTDKNNTFRVIHNNQSINITSAGEMFLYLYKGIEPPSDINISRLFRLIIAQPDNEDGRPKNNEITISEIGWRLY